ncbi:MAG TPA: phage holin family protein [Acidimicrobiales bacterium]|nr:phage holin family protein [Acidimicrobiales bacterium]
MTAVDERPPTRIEAADAAAEGPDLALLFGELRAESQLLVRHEVELAKAELNEARQHLTTGAIGFASAAVLALLAVVLLSAAAAWGLAEALPTWLAFLIVGVAWALLAGIAAIVGRSALRRFDPVPRRTIQTIKEDARWVRTLTS